MNCPSPLPADLLSRELRGPRYTSYPTALAFHAGFTSAAYVQALRERFARPRPLSLYLHVPFCASNCWYCGCNRVISRNAERIDRYVDALLAEIRLQGALVGPAAEVVQIHFGGGTPNSLSADQLALLLTTIGRRFHLAGPEQREWSMEVDPRLASLADIAVWRGLGFNRLSFGIQDIDERVQRAINRLQSRDHIAQLTAAARAAGYASLNYDLVYGLPLQTPESFEHTLDFVIEQRPERVAAYHYAHLPQRFAAQRAIDATQLPSAQERQQLRDRIHDRLVAAGYVAIGLDHYALPTDTLACAQRAGSLRRNFQGYSTGAGVDLIGLGASSISQVGDCFAQNDSDPQRYEQAMAAGRLACVRGYRRNGDDRVRAQVIEAIMCQGEVRFADLDTGASGPPCFAEEIEALQRLDPAGRWLEVGDWGLRISEPGRALLRVVAMVFDRHRDGDEGRYSRVH